MTNCGSLNRPSKKYSTGNKKIRLTENDREYEEIKLNDKIPGAATIS